MMNNVFESDAFGLTELTASITNLPYTPTRLAELGLFEEDSLTTTSAVIEESNGVIDLVPISSRGSSGTPVGNDKRKVHSFKVPHLAERATIMADEVLGVRAFGSENQTQAIETVRNNRLAKLRRQIDYTLEAHRMAAIKGSYYDAAGNLVSLFTTFGVNQVTKSLELDVSSTELRAVSLEVLEAIEDALGGLDFNGVTVLCGKTLWKDLIIHPAIEKTYLNQVGAAALRGDGRQTFEFGGLTWERYRGTAAVGIGDTDAFAIPTGVTGLFLTRYAPADYMEAVNTLGLPYYSKAEPLPMNKGVTIEAQSNPLNLCTRPASVIKLTRT